MLLDEAHAGVDEERDAPEDAAHELLRHPLADGVEDRDRVGHRVGDLLHRRRARLLQVVGADVDRVPLRHVLDRVGDHVGDQPHRRAGREGVGPAGEELLDDVVLRRALEDRLVDAVLLGRDDVERQQPGRRGVDRHRRVHLAERDAVQQLRACRPCGRRARRPCPPRRGPARGRGRSPSAWAGRTRSRGPSGPSRGSSGTARWTSRRWNGPRTSASSRDGRARAGGARSSCRTPDCMVRRRARDRCAPPRARAGHLLLRAGRRDRRPRPRVQPPDAARGPRRRRPAGDPAHAHPLRPRRGDRRARPPLARRRGLGARARRAPPRRPGAARRQRQAPVRRRLRSPLGRGRARAGGQPARRWAAGSASTASASSTRPGTRRTTSATSTRTAARRSSATSAACGSPAGRRSRRRRRPTSTSRRGRRRWTSSPAGRPQRLACTHFGAYEDVAAQLDEVRAGLRALGRGRARHGRRRLRRADRRPHPRARRPGPRRVLPAGDPARDAVAGARPLLAQRVRGRFTAVGSSIELPVSRPSDGSETGVGGAWRVIVRNDDHNTFDHVAATLARYIPGVDVVRGLRAGRPHPQHGPGARVERPPRDRGAVLGAAPRRRPDDGAARAGLARRPCPGWSSDRSCATSGPTTRRFGSRRTPPAGWRSARPTRTPRARARRSRPSSSKAITSPSCTSRA